MDLPSLQLISAIAFAYLKSRFSHDAAHFANSEKNDHLRCLLFILFSNMQRIFHAYADLVRYKLFNTV